MSPQEWKKIVDKVTEDMKVYTRRFVTPLSISSDINVHLEGTGNFCSIQDRPAILTCEHVSKNHLMEFKFYDSEDIYQLQKNLIGKKTPIDASFQWIDSVWNSENATSILIPYEKFSLNHKPICKEELLFFRGYAGENSNYGFGILESNATGYCSQQKVVAEEDSYDFEIFWEPNNTSFTDATNQNERETIKFEDPRGFSGSLVWNTRYVETTLNGKEWSPDDAMVTGLLKRWDASTKTLLVLRIEHLKDWLEKDVRFEDFNHK